MSIDVMIGRLGDYSASELADRAARTICGAPGNRAVSIADDGEVTVEGPRTVIPDEMVGVYTPDTPLFTLCRRIYDDLREAITQRRIYAKPKARKRVTGAQRKPRKEAA